MLQYLLKISWKYLVVAGLAVAATSYLLPPKIETKTVTEVKERVRTVTRIKESPDGTKETIIEEQKETDLSQKEETRVAKKDWSVGVYQAVNQVDNEAPMYTLRVDRRVLLDLSVGAYIRSDREIGLGLSWSF